MVPGNTNTALLEQLIPEMEYSVSVVARYADGEGSSVSDNGKTCESVFKNTPPRHRRLLFCGHSAMTKLEF